MINIKKILVPTDFSDNAVAAYRPAQLIATYYGAIVDFIHVVPSTNYCSESMSNLGIPLLMGDDLYSKMEGHALLKMKDLMRKNIAFENKGRQIVETTPNPARTIADYARREKYDLIAMASKGHHDAAFPKGNITQKVMQYSTVPVFSTERGALKVDNIIVPTDGSSASLCVLPLAISFALACDATITIVNVRAIYPELLEKLPEKTINKFCEKVEAEIFEGIGNVFCQLDGEIRQKEKKGSERQFIYQQDDSQTVIKIKTIINQKDFKHRFITEYLRKNRDMVITSTHGSSQLSHFLLCSIAELVAREFKLPVLSVHPDFPKLKPLQEGSKII